MLPITNRIHNRGGFTYIYSKGLRIRGTFGTLFAVTPRDFGIGVFKFGFSVSKKIGGAVQRNLMRRRLSEIAYVWINENKEKELSSFNSVYCATKFAQSYEELKKDFISQCDSVVRLLKTNIKK